MSEIHTSHLAGPPRRLRLLCLCCDHVLLVCPFSLSHRAAVLVLLRAERRAWPDVAPGAEAVLGSGAIRPPPPSLLLLLLTPPPAGVPQLASPLPSSRPTGGATARGCEWSRRCRVISVHFLPLCPRPQHRHRRTRHVVQSSCCVSSSACVGGGGSAASPQTRTCSRTTSWPIVQSVTQAHRYTVTSLCACQWSHNSLTLFFCHSFSNVSFGSS